MRCPICSGPLPPRLRLASSEVCDTCAQVMLQNMTPKTLADLKSQRDDPPRESGTPSTFPPEWRDFRGVL